MVSINIAAHKQNQLFSPINLSNGKNNTFMVKCTGKTAKELTLYQKTKSFINAILSNSKSAYFATIKVITVPDIATTIMNGKSW